MSDTDSDDQLPTHQLHAIAAFKQGSGFVLALLDDDGELHTFTMNLSKAHAVSTVIAQGVMGIPAGSTSVLKLFE